MKDRSIPTIVIAGTHSGVGKTSLTVGLLAALRRQGHVVQGFKVGPDFIDPLHHEAATQRKSINLDGWMLSQQQVLQTFHRNVRNCDVAVIEGVMGMYDGRDGHTDAGSTAQIAKWLNVPVVLVVDCAAMARSAAAVIKGFREFDSAVDLAAVLLNRVGGQAHVSWLKDAIQPSNPTVAVLGGIPKSATLELPERHLGLYMPHETALPAQYIQQLGDLMEEHVDLNKLMAIARSPELLPRDATACATPQSCFACVPVRIAVAGGDAFQFYYKENLSLLRECGTDLVTFDPMFDDRLPDGVAGVYIGGGYPELHADVLAANEGLKAALLAFIQEGGVVYAECGGLMYLSSSLQSEPQGPVHNMVGVFPFRTVMNRDKMHMGYVEVTVKEGCPLFPANCKARGQVFHFSEILQEQVVGGGAATAPARKGWTASYVTEAQIPGTNPVPEGYTVNNCVASYVHLHFGSAPSFAASLVQKCRGVDVQQAHKASVFASKAAVRGQLPSHTGVHLPLLHSMDCSSMDTRSLISGVSLPNLPLGLLSSTSMYNGQTYRPTDAHADSQELLTDTSQPDSLRSSSGESEPPCGAPLAPALRLSLDESLLHSARPVHRHFCNAQVQRQGGANQSTQLQCACGNVLLQGVRTGGAGARTAPSSPARCQACSSSEDLQQIAAGQSSLQQRHAATQHGKPGAQQSLAMQDGSSMHKGHSLQQGALQGQGPPSNPQPLYRPAGVAGMQHTASWQGPLSGYAQARGAVCESAHAGFVDTAVQSGREGSGAVAGTMSQRCEQQLNGLQTRSDHMHRCLGAGQLMRSETEPVVSLHDYAASLLAGAPWVPAGSLPGSSDVTSSHAAAVATYRQRDDVIVSFSPAATEIAFALGLGNRIAAVTDLCDWPKEVMGKLRCCHTLVEGNGSSLDDMDSQVKGLKRQGLSPFVLERELLWDLQPALVLAASYPRMVGPDAPTVAQALMSSGLCESTSCQALNMVPRTLADVFVCITEVGGAAGVAAEARALVSRLQFRLRGLVAQVAAHCVVRPRVVLLTAWKPLVLGGCWLPELVQLAGGSPLLQGPGEEHRTVTWDDIRAHAPQVLILAPSPCAPGSVGAASAPATPRGVPAGTSTSSMAVTRALADVSELASLPGWWGLPAVRQGQVYLVDHAMISRPGPRLVDGAEALCRIMHPSVMGKRCPDKCVWKLALQGGQRCRQKLLPNYFLPYQ